MTLQRTTKQLQAVQAAFETAGRPLSIEELHALAAKQVASLGVRTVYRAVRRLQELTQTGEPESGYTTRAETISLPGDRSSAYRLLSG